MAKLERMPEQAIIDGFRGTIDFYYWKGIPCARRWPTSPGKIRTQAVMEQWEAFTYASRLWLTLPDNIRQAYNDMAVGTNLTGRDMLMRGYISGILKWYQPPDEMAEL